MVAIILKVVCAWKFGHLVFGIQGGNISRVIVTNSGGDPYINALV